MTWAMPNVTPSLVRQNELKSIMLQPDFTLPISFLNKKSDMVLLGAGTTFIWNLTVTGTDDRPRYYIVGFQLARGNNQTTNSATFDCPLSGANAFTLNVLDAYVSLNGERYPVLSMNTDIAVNKYAKWYYNYVKFYNDYHGTERSDPCLSYIDFINCYPMYVFDVSHQPAKIWTGTTNATLHVNFSIAPPGNTYAYVLAYYDSLFHINTTTKQIAKILN